jgi:hypothetical protein
MGITTRSTHAIKNPGKDNFVMDDPDFRIDCHNISFCFRHSRQKSHRSRQIQRTVHLEIPANLKERTARRSMPATCVGSVGLRLDHGLASNCVHLSCRLPLSSPPLNYQASARLRALQPNK